MTQEFDAFPRMLPATYCATCILHLQVIQPEYTFDLITRSRVLVQLTGKNHFPEGYE